jgi:invasion protein IalB
MTNRFVVGAIALVLGLALGWAVRGVLGYDKGMETITTYDDWRLLCPGASAAAQHCQLEQDSVDTKTRAPVARIALATDKDKFSLIATVPLSVMLPQGLSFVIGGETRTIPYRVCAAAGCMAEVAMDSKLQSGFDAGKNGHMDFTFAQANAKPVAVPVSLKGFAAAQSAYRRAEAKRSAWFWRML